MFLGSRSPTKSCAHSRYLAVLSPCGPAARQQTGPSSITGKHGPHGVPVDGRLVEQAGSSASPLIE